MSAIKYAKNAKPCPFCGNKELKIYCIKSYDQSVIIGWHVLCEPNTHSCGAQGPIFDSKIKAIKLWNRRAK